MLKLAISYNMVGFREPPKPGKSEKFVKPVAVLLSSCMAYVLFIVMSSQCMPGDVFLTK